MSHTYHPILFSTEMVKAILEGRKTQTRRTVKFPEEIHQWRGERQIYLIRMREGYKDGTRPIFMFDDFIDTQFSIKAPYGKVGDILWVRESWAQTGAGILYKADENKGFTAGRWKPSIHMPKAACRLFLQIIDIKVERVQDISEDDAKAEGAQRGILQAGPNTEKGEFHLELNIHAVYKNGFQFIWQSINGEESWNSNPWVWAISFQRIEKPSDFINSIE